MIAALCALLLQGDVERRVHELLDKLASDAIDARAEAAAALIELGPDAAPHLERAAGGRDAEGQGRIREILREIARDAVLRGSWRPARRVDAAWKDVALASALEALATSTGETFKGAAEIPGRVTLDLGRATLWEALDALSRAAPAFTWSLEGEAVAFKAVPRPPFPSVSRDELLAWVDGVEYSRDIDFSGVAQEWAVVGVNLAWTAGLSPAATELRVTEALDGAGRNLLAGGGFRMTQPPKAGAAPIVRLRREEVRVGLQGGARVDRIRGAGQLLFPRAYEDVQAAFGAAVPVKAGDAQVTIRGGTSTKGNCTFLALISFSGKTATARLMPSEVKVIDDQGGEHPAAVVGRGQATYMSAAGWAIHQSYEAAMPPDRRPVAARLRLPKDVFERKIDFDFALPAP
jgi:hypothetical protein